MCGRFTLRTSGTNLAQFFWQAALDVTIPTLKPRYNIAPTQLVGVVRAGNHQPYEYAEVQWGLIPSWAKDKKIAASLINARSETIAEKPAFRAAFKRRRCLIPVDGFYEWKAVGKQKRPLFFHAANQAPFCFAGLWETWQSSETALASAAIITTEANARLREFHDRMPVILAPTEFRSWLNPESPPDQLQALLQPAPDDFLQWHEVTTDVNSARQDLAHFVEPLPELFQGD